MYLVWMKGTQLPHTAEQPSVRWFKLRPQSETEQWRNQILPNFEQGIYTFTLQTFAYKSNDAKTWKE